MNAPAHPGPPPPEPPRTDGPRTRPPGRQQSGDTGTGGAIPAGIALIAVGLVLLAGNLGWVDAGELLRTWWPLAVVGAGQWWMATGARWTGATVALIGLLLLANTQAVLDVDLGRLVFPGLVMVLGVAFLNAGARVRAARDAHGEPLRLTTRTVRGEGAWPPGDLSATAVFGDARLVVSDGGPHHELDRITVTAISVFGDVKIDVPAGWRVEDHTTTVAGDVTIPHDQPTYAESPVVELHGLVLFGDTTVNYLDVVEGGR